MANQMIVKCLFPTCGRHPETNGYCIYHKGFSNGVVVKLTKPIPNKSENKKEIDKVLKKRYPVFLSKPENKYCKIKMEGCTKIANVVHHVRGRVGDQVFEEKDWLASCPSCNILLESKDQLARDMGVKKSKFNKN